MFPNSTPKAILRYLNKARVFFVGFFGTYCTISLMSKKLKLHQWKDDEEDDEGFEQYPRATAWKWTWPWESRSNAPELPSHIILNILSRLPIKSVLRCRCVCKSWKDMISEPYWDKLYATHAPTALMLRVINYNIPNPKNLCMIALIDHRTNAHREAFKKSTTIASGESPRLKYFIGNSCNGMVCLYESLSGEPTYVWNPITGEYVKVPMTTQQSRDSNVTFGLGFSPRANEYKVVRVFYPMGSEQDYMNVEVYTLGDTSMWRAIGQSSFPLHCQFTICQCHNQGFYFGGALYWIVCDRSKSDELICCFNLEKEKFETIPPPPIFSPNVKKRLWYWSNIGVLGCCLSICASDAVVYKPNIEIWVMKKYGIKESWVKELSIKFPAVEWCDPYRRVQVLKVFENGIVVMMVGNFDLFFYDLKIGKFKEAVQSEFSLVPHFPTLVSLQELVGNSMEVLNSKTPP